MRIKYLCVLDGVVHEIPIYKIKNVKMIKPGLSGKTVIMMEMIYETKSRKPFKVIRITFNKASFDDQGIYDSQSDSNTKEFGIRLEYIFSDLYETPDPLPIPIAPVLPTDQEIKVIKTYLNKKYPSLLINSPTAIENSIILIKENYKKDIQKMKASHRSPTK